MRALIFDYDGVIVDSETSLARVAIDLLAGRGVKAGFGDIARFVGASGPEADEAFDDWLAGLLGDRSEATAFNLLLDEAAGPVLASLEPRPGVEGLIRAALEGGWKVGLGSGAVRGPLEATLRRTGLLDSFEAIVTAADVGRGKPSPDIFLEVARRLGVAPEHCVVVEDSLPGCTAAIAAGMSVVACPCELTASSRFPPQARVVPSLEELTLDQL